MNVYKIQIMQVFSSTHKRSIFIRFMTYATKICDNNKINNKCSLNKLSRITTTDPIYTYSDYVIFLSVLNIMFPFLLN